uniref:Dendritic cell-specific transmembrane protein-like domain-containing protein n=1 Tax=Pundamilia nyererei TaxID=303518 RepID=A0A3B4GIQ0_9CICH
MCVCVCACVRACVCVCVCVCVCWQMSGVFQVLTVFLLSVVLLTVDFSLSHVLDIISRHTLTHFNITKSFSLDCRTFADSAVCLKLHTKVSHTSSSPPSECMSPPSTLSAEVYVRCVCCVLLVALFSCLQIYTNRLRHVIAAFYNPKREKTRILFLYNLHIHGRISSSGRKRIISRGQRTVSGFLPVEPRFTEVCSQRCFSLGHKTSVKSDSTHCLNVTDF